MLFDLAIIRMMTEPGYETRKTVYVAPTKALCRERAQDWTKRFQPVGCIVAEITVRHSKVVFRCARLTPQELPHIREIQIMPQL